MWSELRRFATSAFPAWKVIDEALEPGPRDDDEMAWIRRVGDFIHGRDATASIRDGADGGRRLGHPSRLLRLDREKSPETPGCSDLASPEARPLQRSFPRAPGHAFNLA